MLTSRVIPCLDVNRDRVVKGVRFKDLRDAGSPADLAFAYERQGADELVLLDVSATRSHRLETVRTIRSRLSIPFTVGGGVRAIADVEALLDAGADRVSVNTAATLDPSLVRTLAHRFGRQCVVVAIDAARKNDSWEVRTHSGNRGSARDVVDWARQVEDEGAGEILLTSVDRDGTRKGYDLPLLKSLSSLVQIPIIASGGAASPRHLLEALHSGASAVLAASIFHDGEYTVADVKKYLADHGALVRI